MFNSICKSIKQRKELRDIFECTKILKTLNELNQLQTINKNSILKNIPYLKITNYGTIINISAEDTTKTAF